jgi:hypothetical protein
MELMFALLCILNPQESTEDSKKEIERYKIQVRELQDRVAQLEEAAVRDAQMIQRFRTAMKSMDVAPLHPTGGTPDVLKGRVRLVEPKFNFVLVELGRRRNLELGQRFEIMRQENEKGKPDDPRSVRIGSALFEKYIGAEMLTCKLKVVEGFASDMKVEDEAVAILPTITPPDPPTLVACNGLYKITGTSRAGFIVNFGQADGAKQTDLLFIYKDGAAKGKLRLDTVTREFSVGSFLPLAAGAKPPEVGDQIFTRELTKSPTGTVARVDEKTGLVAIDLHARHGMKPGQKIEVRRQGQKVGSLMVTEVQAWGSWTKPEGDTKIEGLRKGDFVGVPEDK